MQIKNIQELRANLSMKITNLINKFQRETNCNVSNIYLSKSMENFNQTSIYINVEIEIEI